MTKGWCDEEKVLVWELGSWDHGVGIATVRIHTPTLSRKREKKYPGLSLPPHPPVSLQCLSLGETNRKPVCQGTWEM